jgi:hypothetical protein
LGHAHQRRARLLKAIVQRCHVVLMRAMSQMPKILALMFQPFDFFGQIVHQGSDEPVTDACGHVLDPFAGYVGKGAGRKLVPARDGVDRFALRAAAPGLFPPHPTPGSVSQVEGINGIIHSGPCGTDSHVSWLTLPIGAIMV